MPPLLKSICSLNLFFVGIFYIISIISNVNAQGIDKQKQVAFYNFDEGIYKKFKVKLFSDTSLFQTFIEQEIKSLKLNGYYFVRIDSIINDKKIRKVYINKGTQAFLKIITNVDPYSIQKYKFLKNRIIKQNTYNKLIKQSQKEISKLEDNGFPFAKIYFDSIGNDNHNYLGILFIKRNNYIYFNNLNVIGFNKINSSFLTHYLGILPLKHYSESKVIKIDKRLAMLPFVSIEKPAEIQFSDSSAIININLKKEKANQFDGIIGFKTNQRNKNIDLTGNLNLNLLNSFNYGEQMKLNWKSFGSSSQNLYANIYLPYILNTSFGTNYSIDILKQDSSFVNITQHIGFQYTFAGLNYFKAYFENRNTQLINKQLQSSLTTLPDYNEQNIKFYGMEFKIQDLDHLIFPKLGYVMNLKNGIGTKIIRKNEYVFDYLYYNLQTSSKIINYKGDLSYYLSLTEVHSIKLGYIFEGIENKHLFVNDLIKIGGIDNLRGFHENSIPVSRYFLLNADYRYYFEKRSFLTVFYDMAFTNNRMSSIVQRNDFLSFGFGAAVFTKAGLINIIYAVGKQNSDNLQIKNGKIQIGFKTLL